MEHLRYLTDHYDEKIRRIHEIGAPLNFIFMTDMHSRLNEFDYQLRHPGEAGEAGVNFELATNAIDSLRYILDRCPEITFVVNGGDIGCDHEDPARVRASYREVMEAFYRLPVPVHSCIGNHEECCKGSKDTKFDPLSYTVWPDELHDVCMKYNPTDENFYYVDLDTADGGYRLAFLNTSDKGEYIPDPKSGLYPLYIAIAERQAGWIEQEVLKTDRKILIFSHCPLDNDLPTVTTLCAMAQEWSPACPRRVFGTYSETAFDVISIKGNVMYLTRFGAGYDRIVPLMRVR